MEYSTLNTNFSIFFLADLPRITLNPIFLDLNNIRNNTREMFALTGVLDMKYQYINIMYD
jgi:hypothetical protein